MANRPRQIKFRTYKCICSQGEHTVNVNSDNWFTIYNLIKELGENINVEIPGGKTYSVPRFYIAKYGLKASELPNLGFPQV